MKTKITIGECYAKTLWYSGTISVINDKNLHESLDEDEIEDLLDEAEEIDFTFTEEWADNTESYVGTENITFLDDLPEGADEEKLKQQIVDEFEKVE